MSQESVEAVVLREQAGTLALANMTESEFDSRLAALKRGQDRIKRIKRELMEVDAHYGVIPGTDKPALLKPGAEVLCSIYGLRADFVPVVTHGDDIASPAISVLMRCELHLGDLSGPVVAVGYGEANSWERKHRYRTGERACPVCGAEGQIRRSGYENKAGKFKGQKGWWCKACRKNWDDPKEPSIIEQQSGVVQNKDPHDLKNTLVKMSKKRAHIDAALTATASSDLFTQDVEEQHDEPAPPVSRTAPAGRATEQSAVREPGSDDDVETPTQPACPHCGVVGQITKSSDQKTSFCRACRRGI